MQLLLAYLGGENSCVHKMESFGALHHPFPLCLLAPMRRNVVLLKRCKQGVNQFVVLKPVLAVMSLVAFGAGLYEKPAWQWILIIAYNVSYTCSLYSLLIFVLANQKPLSTHRPFWKFFAVKSVIITAWYHTHYTPYSHTILTHHTHTSILTHHTHTSHSHVTLTHHPHTSHSHITAGTRSLSLMPLCSHTIHYTRYTIHHTPYTRYQKLVFDATIESDEARVLWGDLILSSELVLFALIHAFALLTTLPYRTPHHPTHPPPLSYPGTVRTDPRIRLPRNGVPPPAEGEAR
jgi:hypothetical protein